MGRNAPSKSFRDDQAAIASLAREYARRGPGGPPTLVELRAQHGPAWLTSRAALGTHYTAEAPCIRCGGVEFFLGSPSCPRCSPPGDVFHFKDDVSEADDEPN
jgi:hypothetical protein